MTIRAFLGIVLCVLIVPARSQGPLHADDAIFLSDLLTLMSINPVLYNAPYFWSNDTSEACTWPFGIECDGDALVQRITKLNLTDDVLKTVDGYLPDSIGQSKLRTLALRFHHINMPKDLQIITSLRYLWLEIVDTESSTIFPSWLSKFSLNTLILRGFAAVGSLTSISAMTSLTELDLEYNLLAGDASLALAKLPLTKCALSHNPNIICPSNFGVCCNNFQNDSWYCDETILNCPCNSTFGLVGTSTGFSASCTQGTWNLNGPLLNIDAITIGSEDTVIINGDFTQANNATLYFYILNDRAGKLIIKGRALLSGTLYIQTLEPTKRVSSFAGLIQADSVEGQFHTVEIETGGFLDNEEICPVAREPRYKSATFDLVLRPLCPVKNAKVITIAVSCSIVGAIILTIIVVIAFVILREKFGFLRRKSAPSVDKSELRQESNDVLSN